jgi:hypothetical protein
MRIVAACVCTLAIAGCVGDAPEDCSANVWYPDGDGDGFADLRGGRVFACEGPAGYVPKGAGDCDDADPTRNPGTTWHLDYDEDGYGDPDPMTAIASCTPVEGRTDDASDCNDRDETIFPSHPSCPLDGGGATSCRDVLAADPNAIDGAYRIDLDATGPGGIATVWCDMTTDGGGWTGLIHPAVMPTARAPGVTMAGTTIAGTYDYCYGDIVETVAAGWHDLAYMRCGDMTARMTVTWSNPIAADDVMFVATLQGRTASVTVNGVALPANIQRLDGAGAVCRFWNGANASMIPAPNQCWSTFLDAPPAIHRGVLAGQMVLELTSGPACSPSCTYGAGQNIAKLFVR